MDKQSRIAVLIDAENVSNKYARLIMNEVSDYGIATYKRIYGDFSNASVACWQEKAREFALAPLFQFNYTKGKNASDAALIIDAMDILYSGNVDGFCLVTSDSDFTKLAIRLREAGMVVIGMGEQKTPTALVAACEQFKFLDLLYQETVESKKRKRKNTENKPKQGKQTEYVETAGLDTGNADDDQEQLSAIPTIKDIGEEIQSIIDGRSGDDGWVNLAEVGVLLQKRIPGFDPRNYKYSKLGKFIESFPFVEVKEVQNGKDKLLKVIYVRIKEVR